MRRTKQSDSANSIATVVSTRVLSPRVAVLWAAFFNFVAFLLFESKVASNIAHGVSARVVSLTVVASGLVGALLWDIFTWRLALPSSSSHALLGGFAGAAVAKAGFGALDLAFLGKTAVVTKLSAVRWGVAGRMLIAWLLTIPCAAAVASLTFLLASSFGMPR